MSGTMFDRTYRAAYDTKYTKGRGPYKRFYAAEKAKGGASTKKRKRKKMAKTDKKFNRYGQGSSYPHNIDQKVSSVQSFQSERRFKKGDTGAKKLQEPSFGILSHSGGNDVFGRTTQFQNRTRYGSQASQERKVKKKKKVVFKGQSMKSKGIKVGLSFLPFVSNKKSIYSKIKGLEIDAQDTQKGHNQHKRDLKGDNDKTKNDNFDKQFSQILDEQLNMDDDTHRRLLADDYEYLKDATVYKFEDLEMDDSDDFYKSTLPHESLKKAIFHFKKNVKDPDYVSENLQEAEMMLTQEIEVILESQTVDKAQLFTRVLDSALDMTSFVEDETKVAKATCNIFQMVDTFIKDPYTREENFLSGFFGVCDKVQKMYKDSKKTKMSKKARENTKKMVAQVSVAMNSLIASLKDQIILMNESDVLNFLKGYLQQLFFIFYDLTSMDFKHWKKRLKLMKYRVLTIPKNLNIFFSNKKLAHFLLRDRSFCYVFDRFYASIVTLILKSEYMTSTNVYIWKFILDCFATHFTFVKSRRTMMQCEQTWGYSENIGSENLLLRFLTTVSIFPYELVLNSDIRKSLEFNLVMISKHFENLSLYTNGSITIIHHALVKKMFVTCLDILQTRYTHESEQFAILRIIFCFVKILGFYANYNTEYGSVEVVRQGILPFKNSFKEIMYRLQTYKTVRQSNEMKDQILESVLAAMNGLNKVNMFTKAKGHQASVLENRFKKGKAMIEDEVKNENLLEARVKNLDGNLLGVSFNSVSEVSVTQYEEDEVGNKETSAEVKAPIESVKEIREALEVTNRSRVPKADEKDPTGGEIN